MRAAIYARISLEKESNPSDAPERQIAECRRLIEEKGWEAAEPPFVDRDMSAYSRKRRPALEAMWAGLEAGDFETVVVWKLDRLTRRFTDTGPIIERLQRAGAQLISVNDSIALTTPMEMAIFGLGVAQAETSSKDTALRVADKWKTRAAQGKPHVGNRCFGYTKDYKQIPSEVKIAREIVRRILDGESLRSTVRYLNDRGITTALGKPWLHSTLRQWLRAPTLAGVRIYRPLVEDPKTGRKTRSKTGIETEGTWEPIISREERNALLVQLGSVPPSGERRRWLLSGLMECAECESRMYGTHGGSKYAQYVCSSETCPNRSVVSRGRIDEYVVDWALKALAGIEMRPVEGGADPEVLRSQVSEDERRLADLNRARFVLDAISQDEWLPQRDELAERLAATKAKLVATEQETAGVLRPGKLEDLQQWWERATEEERKLALNQTISKIVVRRAEVRGARFDPTRVTCYVSSRWLATGATWAETHPPGVADEEAGRAECREIDQES